MLADFRSTGTTALGHRRRRCDVAARHLIIAMVASRLHQVSTVTCAHMHAP